MHINRIDSLVREINNAHRLLARKYAGGSFGSDAKLNGMFIRTVWVVTHFNKALILHGKPRRNVYRKICREQIAPFRIRFVKRYKISVRRQVESYKSFPKYILSKFQRNHVRNTDITAVSPQTFTILSSLFLNAALHRTHMMKLL